MWGEIRRVRRAAWTTRGHEYNSQHPVLVVGNQPFNQSSMTLAIPVMTPAREHENWWEVNLTDRQEINTCALVTGLRTIATADLTGYVDTAGPGDMDQVLYIIRNQSGLGRNLDTAKVSARSSVPRTATHAKRATEVLRHTSSQSTQRGCPYDGHRRR